MTKLIARHSIFPCKQTKRGTTHDDNQPAVTIRVFEGERALTKDNNLVGEFDLTGIPPAPRGIPKIDVSFALDENGILNVTAMEMGSGAAKSITINVDSGCLTQGEIYRMVKEAEKYEEEDERHRQRIVTRNNLGRHVFNYHLQIVQVRSKFPQSDKDKAVESCNDTIKWLDKNTTAEKEELEYKTEELRKIYCHIMTKIHT